MPNWYTTTIIAKGSDADLDRIVATHIVPAPDYYDVDIPPPNTVIPGPGQMFEMDTVIPVPEALKNTEAYRCEAIVFDHDHGRVLGSNKMRADEYQQSDWCKWKDANWLGETWTCGLGIRKKPGELTICFTTRWSPPLPVRFCSGCPRSGSSPAAAAGRPTPSA
jgi:hypothetical protein